MRRNPKYQQDYEQAVSTHAPVYEPPRLGGESITDWGLRAEKQGVEPMSFNRASYFATHWGMRPPLRDPADNKAQDFWLPYPRVLRWEDVGDYFGSATNQGASGEDDAFAPIGRAFDRPVLAFHLWRPLKPQLQQAKQLIGEMQKQLQVEFNEKLKAKKPTPTAANVRKEEWPRYLRLLDALESGAKPGEIINVIEDYQHKPATVDYHYNAQNSLSDNKMAALRLVHDSLRILDTIPDKK